MQGLGGEFAGFGEGAEGHMRRKAVYLVEFKPRNSIWFGHETLFNTRREAREFIGLERLADVRVHGSDGGACLYRIVPYYRSIDPRY